jgi:hypothetical protein
MNGQEFLEKPFSFHGFFDLIDSFYDDLIASD